MFSSKAKPNTNTNAEQFNLPSSAESQTCVIAAGTVIEGSFTTPEDIRLDGHIKGDVRTIKRLVMGETGKIDGTVVCAGESFVRGRIEGELKVDGTLHLHETAYVHGKIIAKELVVEKGASYNGECLVGDQHF